RFIDKKEEFFHREVWEAMNAEPKTVTADVLAAEAFYNMEQHGIMALPVIDEENRLTG
ncbi:MAG: D-arabinose 5-phosphate isomerase, partial [Gemmatimonadetes bacterium]|nr:D-arabinose 5-phosphate isomerase [Gemmatimonadota bacterium]NIS00569.1 D-arabinose 5-phosphate isomerase [Gemmatimonadota bacterium]NIT65863.1 D-arabinose 5-phosphate isomerase [Gemmatimonadota bacterium]NIV22796.1 D-arabinose 5-phosphate isomerase [Gemmatimonadota bacterium]NIW74324.1 D-arabinose 5-phosphate isomerase [Gemmatimonadota bacterium]